MNWSLSHAEAELKDFKAWLSGRTFVGESAIAAEIVAREHMCGLLAASAGFTAPDMIADELTLRGLFRTDLVVGSSRERQFALIEFEPAEHDSIFGGRRSAQYRHWSVRLEHGFGQIVDWAWLRADQPNDITLTTAFGGAINASAFLLICGRDASMRDEMERRRFSHRQNCLKIDGVPARLMTYDGMVGSMEINLATAKSFSVLP